VPRRLHDLTARRRFTGKGIFEICGFFASASPISPPGPVTTLTTPAGSTSAKMSLNINRLNGVLEAGLITVQFSAPIAGAIFQAAINNGKFQGMMPSRFEAFSLSGRWLTFRPLCHSRNIQSPDPTVRTIQTGPSHFGRSFLIRYAAVRNGEEYDWDLDSEQTSTLFCPMVHASGLFNMVACLQLGAPFVLIEHFDPDAILDAIERHRCTWIAGLPFMFAALVQQQRQSERDVNSLRTCLVGGDVCPARLQEQFLSTFGVPLRSIWAATEACGSLTYSLQPGPVTRIVRGAQVRLVDDHDAPVAPGQLAMPSGRSIVNPC